MDEKQNKALLEKRESKRKEGWGFGLLYACGMMEDSGWKKKEEGRRRGEIDRKNGERQLRKGKKRGGKGKGCLFC